jgi:hypothetical protein
MTIFTWSRPGCNPLLHARRILAIDESQVRTSNGSASLTRKRKKPVFQVYHVYHEEGCLDCRRPIYSFACVCVVPILRIKADESITLWERDNASFIVVVSEKDADLER